MTIVLFWVWIIGAIPLLLSVVWGAPYIGKYEVIDRRVKALRRVNVVVVIAALPAGWLSVTTSFPDKFGPVSELQVSALIWVNGFFIVYALVWWMKWWQIRRSNRKEFKRALNDKKRFNKLNRRRVRSSRLSR